VTASRGDALAAIPAESLVDREDVPEPDSDRIGSRAAGSSDRRGGDMGNVVIDMSMSLDGYIAAPNDNVDQGLGEDGMRLHNWMFDDPSVFERIYGDLTHNTGAVIIGRRTYDNSLKDWGGKGPLEDVPCFVVTHRPVEGADRVFRIVTDGIESALEQAQAVAGDKVIGLMGANIDQQFLAAGLVDEIRIHVVDVLLGGGRRLFDRLPERAELELTGLSQTGGVTHLEYRVAR
jgi:dihydrofolate reductase